jgi:hypothetical protein
MLIKVIFTDGSTGMIKASRLGKLVKNHQIAAYQTFDRWVEVRRKQSNPNYRGPERRKQGLILTNSM